MGESTSQRRTVSFRVEPELRARLERLAADSNQPVSQVIEQILRRELFDTAASVDDRLAHIEQIVNRFDGRHRADLRVLKELVGSFVYLFMMYFPQLPEGVRDAAQVQASRRMADFIAFVSGSLKQGISVLNPEDTEPMPDGMKTDATPQSQENAA